VAEYNDRCTGSWDVISPVGVFMGEMEVLSPLRGLYQLTAQGALAFYNRAGEQVIDQELTALFQPYAMRLLVSYLRDPQADVEGSPCRIAVLGNLPDRRWRSMTLVLETPVLRRLYKVQQARRDEVTPFQRQNRQQSAYRGMQMLLEYKQDTQPGIPIYCPVLFDRRTTLAQYPDLLDHDPPAAPQDVPVFDVINLMLALPANMRTQAPVWALLRRIYQGIVERELRGSDKRDLSALLEAHSTEFAGREPRRVEGPFAALGARAGEGTQAESTYPGADGIVTRVTQAIDPGALRHFQRLGALSLHELGQLAADAQVYSAPAGVELLKRDSTDDGTLYLLRGTVTLKAADGSIERIDGGSDKARSPIASLKPRKYDVWTLTPVHFLWVPDAVFAAIAPKPATFGAETRPRG